MMPSEISPIFVVPLRRLPTYLPLVFTKTAEYSPLLVTLIVLSLISVVSDQRCGQTSLLNITEDGAEVPEEGAEELPPPLPANFVMALNFIQFLFEVIFTLTSASEYL